MDQLAWHADYLRSFQTEMNRAAHRDDEKTNAQSEPALKSGRSEWASLNVGLSPLSFDSHADDHTEVACTTKMERNSRLNSLLQNNRRDLTQDRAAASFCSQTTMCQHFHLLKSHLSSLKYEVIG